MLSDKEIKEKYRPVFWKEPDKYYPTSALRKEGFNRFRCKACRKPFWSVKKRKACGDPGCNNDVFSFIGRSPARYRLTYLKVWQKFSKMFQDFGYTPIKRYSTVARWNPTMEYTNASIAAFQPYVISGEAEPPANPLIIPQFSFRTNDIDNVGITGSHMITFNMIGQLMFVKPEEWDQNKVFNHIYQWLINGMGIPKEELTFHEDAWAGGGNLGCCMEFFSRGCEIGNQVYMLYEQTSQGISELSIKVLDMGMGMERAAWFSLGTSTIYDAAFPGIVDKLLRITKIKSNKHILKKYVQFAGLLNIDEVKDIDKAWSRVARKIKVPAKKLRELMLPMSAVYSIAEHARTLLILLSDGALPSNTGGGYNLRLIARRAFSFIDNYKWNINLFDVCKWHASDLKPLFPELSENLGTVRKILEIEKSKYESTKLQSEKIIHNIIRKKLKLGEEKLIQLYDSQGITPEIIKEIAKGHNIKVDVPEDFYSKISARHENIEKSHAIPEEEKLDISGIKPTEALYYDDYKKTSFRANVVQVIGKNVILDRTYFYPTSGGQLHDTGTIAGEKVVNVFKQAGIIVHVLAADHLFPAGEEVECQIDYERRVQLAFHHTATHIVNAAARNVLGSHVNQRGAKKTVEKAHIDITHYEALSQKEIEAIEAEANRIVKANIPIHSSFMGRSDAEKKFGTNIYQGGVAPGKRLRIVNISGTDVEACGGTHIKNTGEISRIKIIKATKIQDGIVRITFAAGKAAEQETYSENTLLDEAALVLGVKPTEVPSRAQDLFNKWKYIRKAGKKGIALKIEDFKLKDPLSEKLPNDELLRKTAEIFKTQIEHVPKTAKRFINDISEIKKKLGF